MYNKNMTKGVIILLLMHGIHYYSGISKTH